MFERGVFKILYKCINEHTRYVCMFPKEYEAGFTVCCIECPESMCEIPDDLKERYEQSQSYEVVL